jgi:uncharacterized protein DUF4389
VRLIEPPAVQLVAAGPVEQRRLTVAFRLILLIPQIFVLFLVNLAGFVVAFLGWWAALFTGRLPAFAVSYLSGLVRWNARVYGYLVLLTDAYPPFTFDDDLAYPVVIAIPGQGRLNRFAVFFRFVLMLWGCIVLNVVLAGVNTIMIFIAWLITLSTGKLPAPLHLAFTAALRYQTRYYCYLSLLTPTYPWKLFGDEPEASAPVTAAPTAPQPVSWPLVLPRSAKVLLIVFIVLGLVTNVGDEYASAKFRHWVANSGGARTLAISHWNTADNTLNANMNRWQTAVQACDQKLSCVTTADRQAASAMSAFASQVTAIAMPADAAPAATRLAAGATKVAQDFTALSAATTVAQYQSAVTGTGLSRDLTRVQTGVGNVADALDNS